MKNKVLQLLEKDKSDSHIICNSILIDNYLWEYRRNKNLENEPVKFHRVVSIFY